ncbi:MAG: putative transport system permease protein [Thermoplasmata archaeon]|jgi:ABC-type lipoprotein release transport system permease subunit|nr:putative transport system permease protein [Thermoplasmata archaeon]
MTVARDLMRAEWANRKRTYVALAILLAATSATYFLVLASVDGLEGGVGREISTTLGGDVRIARARTGVGDGEPMTDLQDVLTGLRYDNPSARFAPRLESEGIFLHGADFTTAAGAANATRSAAILVGIDPDADAQVVDLDAYVSRGVMLGRQGALPTLPDGEPVVPIFAGEDFVHSANLTVYDGSFAWSSIYNLTAGHVENNQLVSAHGLLVGTYATGFRMIDRLVVYAPRGDVARLLGYFATNPPANVVLAAGDQHALVASAQQRGFVAIASGPFRESYLGPVFDSVRVTAWIVVASLTLMTGAWIAHTLARQVREDRATLATLRAIGIPDQAFGRVYQGLGLWLGLAGGVVGVAFATLLSWLLALAFRAAALKVPPPAPSWLVALAILALAVAAGVGASRWALARLRRQPIRDALGSP